MSTMQTSGDATWRDYLVRLPEIEPPAHLQMRIEAAVAARRDRRRVRWWRGLAAAAVLGLGLVSVGLIPRGGTEQVATNDPGVPAPSGAVRRIDDALAQAYARGAGEAELTALWEARARVLAASGASEGPLLVQL